MKKRKKMVEITDEFSKILHNIKSTLKQENMDYILDASGHPDPLSLLTVAYPDMVLLNVNLPDNQAVDVTGTFMQENTEINLGMITCNPSAYYVSLCATFSREYSIDISADLQLIPGIITGQQLN